MGVKKILPWTLQISGMLRALWVLISTGFLAFWLLSIIALFTKGQFGPLHFDVSAVFILFPLFLFFISAASKSVLLTVEKISVQGIFFIKSVYAWKKIEEVKLGRRWGRYGYFFVIEVRSEKNTLFSIDKDYYKKEDMIIFYDLLKEMATSAKFDTYIKEYVENKPFNM